MQLWLLLVSSHHISICLCEVRLHMTAAMDCFSVNSTPNPADPANPLQGDAGLSKGIVFHQLQIEKCSSQPCSANSSLFVQIL